MTTQTKPKRYSRGTSPREHIRRINDAETLCAHCARELSRLGKLCAALRAGNVTDHPLHAEYADAARILAATRATLAALKGTKRYGSVQKFSINVVPLGSVQGPPIDADEKRKDWLDAMLEEQT